MKQKNADQDVVTKGFFKSILEIELNEVKQEIDEKAKEYRDQILTKLDGVMGELESMREDAVIGTHQISELRKQGADHEKRIKRLEHPRAA